MRGAARRTDAAATGKGFDYTAAVRRLCEHVTRHTDELAHIEFSRVAVSFAQTRRRVSHGMYASLTPMRFEGGQQFTERHGRRWTCQRLLDPAGKHEYLYILSLYLPRFQDAPLREKLLTTFHELWHIGPRFDGDLRRHEGRCYAHGRSQAEFDAHCGQLVDRWLAGNPPEQLYDFLRHSFQELQAIHGRIYGIKIRTPKLIPADENTAENVEETAVNHG